MARIIRKETNNVTLTTVFTRDEILKMLGAHMLVESGFSPEQPREALTVQVLPPPSAPQPWSPPPAAPAISYEVQIAQSVEVVVTLDFNKLPRNAAEVPK